MSLSIEYQVLRRQLSLLRRSLLPEKLVIVDPNDLTEELVVKTLSFRVLAHAELEEYLESRVSEIVTQAIKSWKVHNRVTNPLLHILGYSGRVMTPPLEVLVNKGGDIPNESKINDRLKGSWSDLQKYIREKNHGIREKNLMKMLISIGFPIDTLDPLEVTEFDDFGQKRGMAAHKSTGSHIVAAMNPSDEFKRVIRLTHILKPIDRSLNEILRQTRT